MDSLNPRNRPRVFFIWAEVVGGGKSRRAWRSGKQLFRKAHVSVQRFENMLPRTYGMWTANAYGLTRKEASDEIGDKTIGRPVASADDVAGAAGGEGLSVSYPPRRGRSPLPGAEHRGPWTRSGAAPR